MKEYGFIYLTINKINGMQYIGQKKYIKGWETYLGSGKHIRRAIAKYGKHNFERIILSVAYSKDELDRLEIETIRRYNATCNKNFYNIAPGGEGGNNFEGYSKEEMANFKEHQSKVQKKFSEEKRTEIIKKARMTMDNKTEEEKMLYKERKSKAVAGERNPMYGIKHKESSKQIIREKAIGRKGYWEGKRLTNDAKKKISESKKGLITSRSKEVICLNTKERFMFICKAREKYNIKGNTVIQECCKGKRKSAGKLEDGTKLQWKYYDDYLKELAGGKK